MGASSPAPGERNHDDGDRSPRRLSWIIRLSGPSYAYAAIANCSSLAIIELRGLRPSPRACSSSFTPSKPAYPPWWRWRESNPRPKCFLTHRELQPWNHYGAAPLVFNFPQSKVTHQAENEKRRRRPTGRSALPRRHMPLKPKPQTEKTRMETPLTPATSCRRPPPSGPRRCCSRQWSLICSPPSTARDKPRPSSAISWGCIRGEPTIFRRPGGA